MNGSKPISSIAVRPLRAASRKKAKKSLRAKRGRAQEHVK